MLRKAFTQSIQYRYFVALASALVMGTLVLSVTIAVDEWRAQHALLQSKGAGFAQYLAKISLDPLIMDDTIQLDSIVNEAKYDDDILYVLITGKKGVIKTSQFSSINYTSSRMAAIKGDFHRFTELSGIIDAIKARESLIEVDVPITTGGQRVGAVVVGLSKHAIIRSILSTIGFIITINMALAATLAVLLMVISRRILFDPISSLVDASLRIARGDLSTRLNISGVGEMQQLIDTFNRMTEDLQHTTVSKEYVNNIIKSMTEALLILSPDYRVTDHNAAASALLGYGDDELTGLEAGKVFDATLFEGLTGAGSPEAVIREETWCLRKNGDRIPIHLSASGMLDLRGELQGIVCTALDISRITQVSQELAQTNDALKLEVDQRTQAQEEATWLNADLERRKAALEDANRELESFSYSVSHDLRAPLRHINGFTAVLKEDYRHLLDDSGRDILDRICAASTRMGALIDDLLGFSRISRAHLSIVDLDLSHCAAKIVAMFRESEPEHAPRVEIAEGLIAKGDVTLLDMVLQNLIGNAWKYSSRNPDALIEIGRSRKNGREWFFVRDNGVGFDMSYSDKLFKVFERLHGQEFEGTGIGLATAHRIIKRHGGDIWAESEIGKGSTFYFTLSETG